MGSWTGHVDWLNKRAIEPVVLALGATKSFQKRLPLTSYSGFLEATRELIKPAACATTPFSGFGFFRKLQLLLNSCSPAEVGPL